jgi:hypothetical protein
MAVRAIGRGARLSACALAAVGLLHCGGNAGPHPVTPGELSPDQIDADPLALLPGSAAVVATVDAHALYASASVGSQLTALSEKLIPIGDEAGFNASRDVDRVVVGTYAGDGLDVAAVLSGRFDEARMKQAAEAHTQTRAGGVVTESTYAGRRVYTVGDGEPAQSTAGSPPAAYFSILTPKTALAGTQTGIRHALDRIHDGHPKRELAPWVQRTIDTPNAAATLCADFAQPLATAAIGSFSLSWVKGIDRVRVVAELEPPGAHIAGTITYADAPSAAAGASGIERAGALANLLSLTGLTPKLENLAVSAVDTNVEVAFSVDDQAMRNLLVLLSKYVHK